MRKANTYKTFRNISYGVIRVFEGALSIYIFGLCCAHSRIILMLIPMVAWMKKQRF